MIDVKALWKKRFKQYIKETSRYGKLIFNDHFKIALVFALGAGAYYYQLWLKQLPEQFPSLFIVVLILAFFSTQSPIRTFLQKPDIIFLLPIETRLNPYFTLSKLFAFVAQAYILLFVYVALLPLYMRGHALSLQFIILCFAFLLAIKVWNIWMKWHVQYFEERRVHISDWVVRFSINFVLLYFLFSHANFLYVIIMCVIAALLIFYYASITKKKQLKWEFLIDIEAKRMQTFYRIANLFTDVPQVKEQVRKRQWLSFLYKKIPYAHKSTFLYLYIRTFIRSSDYLGMYLRLLVIGGLLLYYLPFLIGKIITVFLFLYFSGFQFIPLFRQHREKIWLTLYPVNDVQKEQSFLKLLFSVLLVQSLVFFAVLLFVTSILYSLVIGAFGIVFCYLFTYVYVKRKIHKF